MLLTITTTHLSATDSRHLLRKHPGRTHVFERSFGRAHVFYPEANSFVLGALLLEVDPVGLVRNRRDRAEDYFNDRPYVASSFLSVALGDVFSSAIAGKPRDREAELAYNPILSLSPRKASARTAFASSSTAPRRREPTVC
ncbi:MAG TPA: hypothetical protein VGR78_18245 [Verrucomicrobiae bacterium]|jgi:hypothetical protein|nr:hypothetical protein [Verrucomicrobiae bacterium]